MSIARSAVQARQDATSDPASVTLLLKLAHLSKLWQRREMLIPPFLARLRERRQRVDRDVSDLLTFLGDRAYYEARTRARACREKQDRAGDRHWSRVAVEIADREDA